MAESKKEEKYLQVGNFTAIYPLSEKVVIKKARFSENVHLDRIKDFFDNEKKVLRKLLGCQNIVRICDNVDNNDNSDSDISICLERMDIDLFDLILSPTKKIVIANFDIFQWLFREIALGVKSCHDNKVIKIDIKPENILVKGIGKLLGVGVSPRSSTDTDVSAPCKIFDLENFKQLEIKICDFNLANILNKSNSVFDESGTPGCRAPEVILLGVSTAAADIWSLGVLYLEVLLELKQIPFADSRFENEFENILRFFELPSNPFESSDSSDSSDNRPSKSKKRKMIEQWSDVYGKGDFSIAEKSAASAAIAVESPLSRFIKATYIKKCTKRADISDTVNTFKFSQLINLMESMFQFNPEKRLTIDEVLNHSYFK